MNEQQQFEHLVKETAPQLVDYWLQQYMQAKNNQSEAMVNIALFYKEKMYFEKMYRWLERAMYLQDANAFYELANCYFEALDGKGSEQQAFKLYQQAAMHNHPDAINNLADMYLNGEGTEIDETKAFIWFTKAAQLGVVEAMYTLGILYEQGLGTEENAKLAFQHYMQAATGGYEEAMYRVGMIYFSGELGQQRDEVQAVKWFMKAAEKFQVDAIYNLAYCFEQGAGTEQNSELAIHYYKQASMLGDIESSKKLATIFISINPVEAEKWAKKAAQQMENSEVNYNDFSGNE